MKIKAKVHAVDFGGTIYPVMALTKQGAARDLLEHISGEINSDLATGEQLYDWGKRGIAIINEDKYKVAVDPNQQELPITGPSIDELVDSGHLTAAQEAGDTPTTEQDS